MKSDRKYFLLGVILLITLISYWPVLSNHAFVWDDDGYITNNQLIKSFHLKEIFSSNVMGNYHPITVLVLAVEYFFFGLNPTGYHIVNLVLHLLNVLLVYQAINLLCRKPEVALIAALLFGIHPIHVESVAWVSGLKDLLFTFFFLSSWIFYLKYVFRSQRYFYYFSLFLFLISLSSKSMAVTLPVILLLTDFYMGRKCGRFVWLDKIPFFLLAFPFGILAIITQKSSGNISVLGFSILQQWAFACYGFVHYLIKLVLPIKLSAFYPYPVSHPDAFPVIWYTYFLVLIVFAFIMVYAIRNNRRIFFGLVFFTITLFLVLQWFPVGKAIMADRYCYLPSLGIFFLAGEGFYISWTKYSKWLTLILLTVIAFFFSARTMDRCGIWKNDTTLWNDVLRQYDKVPLAYLNRGIAYARVNEFDKAIEDIGKAIQLDSNYPKAYNNNYAKAYFNRGNMYLNAHKPEMALKDFDKCIELNTGYVQAYFNRGNIYTDNQEYDKALADYSKAIELNPGEARPYINRGFIYGIKKEYEKASKDFDKALILNPKDPGIYFNRGLLYMNIKAYGKSIESFTKALEINPNDAEAFFNRGLAEYYSSDKQATEMDMKKAAALGYKPADDFLRVLSGNQ